MEFEILLRYINDFKKAIHHAEVRLPSEKPKAIAHAKDIEIKLISAIAEAVSDLKVAEEKIKLLEAVSSNEKIKQDKIHESCNK